MSGVMTVAKKVASRRHMIAKKPVTVKMMTIRKHPCLATGTGKLPSLQKLLACFCPVYFFRAELDYVRVCFDFMHVCN